MPRQRYYAVILLNLVAVVVVAASTPILQPGDSAPPFQGYTG